MKVHQILLIATILATLLCVFGFVGVACGLETPKSVMVASGSFARLLGCATAVCWVIGKVARAVL